MATQGQGFDITCLAGTGASDDEENQYRAVRIQDADTGIPRVTYTGDRFDVVLGVTQTKANEGQLVEVRYLGITKCIVDASGSVSAGSLVRPTDGGGCEDVEGAGTLNDERAFGLALEDGSAEEIVRIKLIGCNNEIEA